MAIDKKELQSRLWTERTNGLKITANSLATDQIEIINSACTCPLLGDENFVQKAAIYVQRKVWIGKFSDYKTRIGAGSPSKASAWADFGLKRPLLQMPERKGLAPKPAEESPPPFRFCSLQIFQFCFLHDSRGAVIDAGRWDVI